MIWGVGSTVIKRYAWFPTRLWSGQWIWFEWYHTGRDRLGMIIRTLEEED